MAKYIYPAIFMREEEGGFSVIFPDLKGCCTQGEDIGEAYEMAEDALCLMLYDLEERGAAIKEASDISEIEAGENAFVSLVACDTLEYRQYYDNRAVKKTLTIPSWLNVMSERAGVNFSAVLQDALKRTLGVTDR